MSYFISLHADGKISYLTNNDLAGFDSPSMIIKLTNDNKNIIWDKKFVQHLTENINDYIQYKWTLYSDVAKEIKTAKNEMEKKNKSVSNSENSDSDDEIEMDNVKDSVEDGVEDESELEESESESEKEEDEIKDNNNKINIGQKDDQKGGQSFTERVRNTEEYKRFIEQNQEDSSDEELMVPLEELCKNLNMELEEILKKDSGENNSNKDSKEYERDAFDDDNTNIGRFITDYMLKSQAEESDVESIGDLSVDNETESDSDDDSQEPSQHDKGCDIMSKFKPDENNDYLTCNNYYEL